MEGITNAIKSSRANTSSCVDRQQPQDVEISPFEVKQIEATVGNDGKDTEIAKCSDEKTNILKPEGVCESVSLIIYCLYRHIIFSLLLMIYSKYRPVSRDIEKGVR